MQDVSRGPRPMDCKLPFQEVRRLLGRNPNYSSNPLSKPLVFNGSIVSLLYYLHACLDDKILSWTAHEKEKGVWVMVSEASLYDHTAVHYGRGTVQRKLLTLWQEETKRKGEGNFVETTCLKTCLHGPVFLLPTSTSPKCYWISLLYMNSEERLKAKWYYSAWPDNRCRFAGQDRGMPGEPCVRISIHSWLEILLETRLTVTPS